MPSQSVSGRLRLKIGRCLVTGRGSRVTPDYTRLQDAFSSANRLSARVTNPIGASLPRPAEAADWSLTYKILDDAIVPRHSRPQLSPGSDHSRHCGSFHGSPSRVSGQAVWRSTGPIDVP